MLDDDGAEAGEDDAVRTMLKWKLLPITFRGVHPTLRTEGAALPIAI
jgi:hypothetical protein